MDVVHAGEDGAEVAGLETGRAAGLEHHLLAPRQQHRGLGHLARRLARNDDGAVRDIDAWAEGFFVLAGSVMPSHAHVDIVDFGGTVSVAGMVVSSDDIVHADRHGCVVIPHAAVAKLPEAALLLARREKIVLDACRAPGFKAADLGAIFARMDDIH